MKVKSNIWLPMVLLIVFAFTRWPGLLPLNFSAAYALAFCAGVYFQGRLGWWLPLGTLVVSDLALNCYYQFARGIDAFQFYQLINYVAFAALIWLGRRFRATAAWWKLVCGGLLGAVLFYLITNTAAWLFNPFHNPEYTRNLAGWVIALTKGTGGYPETWQFFRNTLLSGGLFTGLFVGAMKLGEEPGTEEEEKAAEEPEESEGAAAEESKA
ncbi:MAG TPA: DUF6580 family putative transport protein [Candidatus Nitrosotalea sp.]|nr:DUF6580 family putative transport protein [Candidatus Nitrosotalea sp.]